MLVGDEVLQLVPLAASGSRAPTTIAKPEKMAPATKNGGKIVACHSGTIDTAKSNDTTVCTENTSGVEMPAEDQVHLLVPPPVDAPTRASRAARKP